MHHENADPDIIINFCEKPSEMRSYTQRLATSSTWRIYSRKTITKTLFIDHTGILIMIMGKGSTCTGTRDCNQPILYYLAFRQTTSQSSHPLEVWHTCTGRLVTNQVAAWSIHEWIYISSCTYKLRHLPWAVIRYVNKHEYFYNKSYFSSWSLINYVTRL